VAWRCMDFDRAEKNYREALQLFAEIGHRLQIAQMLERFAIMAAGLPEVQTEEAPGRWERAAQLVAAASTIREDMGTPWTLAEGRTLEPEVNRIRAAMGAGSGPVWQAAREIPMNEAVAFALHPARRP
jgi:hypothetical protein